MQLNSSLMQRLVYIWLVSPSYRVVSFNRFQKSSLKNSRAQNSRAFSEKSGNAVIPGHVYFVATPLGNLGDITGRAIDVLKAVDIICAEDTRHTLKLLRHFEVPMKPLISHHEHNWSEQVPSLISMALQGKSIAVVSDAGTPGISDPGKELAAACRERGIPLHPIPGASAVVAALSVSGFPGSIFTFRGFFPAKGKERVIQLSETAACDHTVVFFEAPHRILYTLQDLERDHKQGERPCLCCREITKLHEELHGGSVRECRLWLEGLAAKDNEGGIRGEFTVVLGPQATPTDVSGSVDGEVSKTLSALREDGVRRSEAVRLVADMTGQPRARIYKLALLMVWE